MSDMPKSRYGGGPGAGLTSPLFQTHTIGEEQKQLLPQQRKTWS